MALIFDTSGAVMVPGTDTFRSGWATVDLVAGQSFKVESSPDGEEVFNEECPEGKTRRITVFIKIVDSDA